MNEKGLYIRNVLDKIFSSLKEKEGYFNHLDSIVGDGDTGTGLARACYSVLQKLNFLQFDDDFAKSVASLGEIISESFGGTSGPLYGNFLS